MYTKTTWAFCSSCLFTVIVCVYGADRVCFHIQQEVLGQDAANKEERHSAGDVAS